ncbi:MAG: type I pullulanase [Ruminococcus sp.]|nr:type I pullulanase [Ruminococcus sp.]MDY2857257.1 type I pullulanase [Oscillospiraceae bacterium]
MKLNKIIAAALAVMLVGSTASVAASAADSESSNPYEAQAAKYDEQAYSGDDLGAICNGADDTTFKLWSPSASDVKLNIFERGSDDEAGATKVGTFTMEKEDNGIWTIKLVGNWIDLYYTYSVTDAQTGKTVETADPYAKAAGVNGDRSMVVDLSRTDPDGWEQDNNFKRVENQSDASVWEVHVKDFTYDSNSGVSEKNRGKYLGFTESNTTLNDEGKIPTGMNYLKSLGINYVQITPFYDYGSVDEAGSDTQFNWGYDPKNYNVPEGSYSSNPYDGNVRIKEAKEMVKSIHDNGMGVIMDVVYNHTYSTDSVFQNTVPNYYYRMNADGSFSSGSGCGNDTASERAMYRKYMVDSVVYWAKEYHVDGFRFDLMGLHDVETMNLIRAELDKIDPNIIMYGEGWTMSSTFDKGTVASTQANAKLLSDRIGFFNDQIRDGIKGSVFDSTGKGYVQGKSSNAKAIYYGLLANTQGGNWKANQPEQTVTYASCHDNATLYDRLVYSMGGDFTKRYDEYIKMNKLSAAITYASQGTTFMLAGEEFARTKQGDENSYSSSVDINKLDWSRTAEYGDLVSYYKGMLEFRNYFAPVRTATKLDNVTGSYNNSTGLVQMVYADNTNSDWKNVVMLFNDGSKDQTVTLDSALPDSWVTVVNGQMAGVANLGEVSGRDITVPAGEALVLVDKDSYIASGVESTKGVVEVRYIDDSTGETLSTLTLSGKVGEYYCTQPSNSYSLEYNLISVTDNNEGVYTEDKIVVEYHYEPNLVKFKNLNGDGDVTLADVVMIQRNILGQLELSGSQIANADVNKNGVVDISDAVLIVRHILGYETPLSVGTITVSYVDEDGNKLREDTVTRMKAGTDYSVKPADIPFYELDKENMPGNSEGIVAVGNTLVVYHYVLGAQSVTVHVQVPEGITPNLYVWEDNGTNNCGSWPGTAMTDADGDGWFECTFATSGTYNWIVNDGTHQTIDNNNYSGDQWIILNSDWTTKVVTTTINVRLPEGATWSPYLYLWQTALQTGDKDYNPAGGWPGAQLADFDKDGWYSFNFYAKGEGVYNWIVNDGKGNQTADNVDYAGSLWITMQDATTAASVETEKPAA